MDQIISSFKEKKTLNGEVWDNVDTDNVGDVKLKPEIRSKLLEIAKTFIESLKLPNLDIEDVLFLGSLSGYNWSKFSDIDIHILIDKTSIEGDATMVEEFFDAKKKVFNDTHEITIKGFEVELYVQDVNENNHSVSVYSVLYSKWLQIPEMENPEVDKKAIIQKVKDFNKQLKSIKSMADSEKKITKIDALKEKIRKYRKAGLEGDGEFSTENLVFKYLRRSGYMEELVNMKIEVLDQLLSLQEGKL